MEVVLLQRVEKLGKMGDVVNVRPGYARNFLLPKKFALRATKINLEHFEKEKAHLEQLNLKHKDEAETLAKAVEGASVIIVRQASEAGHLYGSVTNKDIAEGLNHSAVKKTHVSIEHPIKTIGIHNVRVQLHPEVSVSIRVNVAKSEDEAKAQAKTLEEETTTASPEDATV